MKILLVHTYYRVRGGEDVVFESERDLLKHHGHDVVTFIRHNTSLLRRSAWVNAGNMLWSAEVYRELRSLLRREHPDLVHFHNIFPAISPSAYYACHDAGVPVVQTLHNYRLICPGALLMRDGKICEDCMGRPFPWPGAFYGCWQGSKMRTGAVAAMLGVHRFLHTWTKQVNRYIALTEFSRQKFIAGGLPSYKVVVKPNFVSQDPGIGSHQGGYALFVGRLSPEKGIWTLLRAWRALKDIPLKIVGHGLLQQEVEQFVRGQGLGQISVEGRRSREEVFRLMKDANVLIVPSEWYEPFGMIIIEAFSCGLPVIVAKIGGMEELVENGKTGLFFAPGDAESLAGKIRWAWEHPSEMHRMRQGARRAYEQKYTAEVNYRALMSVYENLGSDENED